MIKGFSYLAFCGFFLGVSVFAPGFSGSIIAIIMGIYPDLLRIASNPFKRLKENIAYITPLALGAAISAVLFVFALKFLFSTYEKATYFLFVGLIAGNLPVISKEIKESHFRKSYLFYMAVAFVVALALGVWIPGVGKSAGAEGIGAGMAMLPLNGLAAGIDAPIPGMSVSMILILMGVYERLIDTAESLLLFDFTYLFPFALFCASAAAGLVLASRGIKTVFDRAPGVAHSLVFGFMAGSLIGILMQSTNLYDPNFHWIHGVSAFAAGLAVSMLFVALGKRMELRV